MRKFVKNLFPWIILFLVILSGIVADFAVRQGVCLLIVEDLRDIIKALLGAQATIAVLSLSVLTLIGVFVDKSYWGISISDFYSNKKNPQFTSLTIILLGLIFMLLSVLALILNLYNTAIMIFVATLFIIIWSTKQIYHVFKGDKAVKMDIEKFFDETFESTSNEKKMHLFETYCKGWKSIYMEQTEVDFQDYKETFFNFYWKLFKAGDSSIIKILCNSTKDLIEGLLISANNTKKKQGIKFIEDVYCALRLLDSKQFEDTSFLEEFVLLSDVVKEFLEALQNMPKDWIENFDWYSLTGSIDTFAIKFDTKAKFQELTASLQISLQMGWL